MVVAFRERKVGFPRAQESFKFPGGFIGHNFLEKFIATNVNISQTYMANIYTLDMMHISECLFLFVPMLRHMLINFIPTL